MNLLTSLFNGTLGGDMQNMLNPIQSASAADPWAGMRQIGTVTPNWKQSASNVFGSMSAMGKQMAHPASFAPVQFSGAPQAGQLSQLVAQLMKGQGQ